MISFCEKKEMRERNEENKGENIKKQDDGKRGETRDSRVHNEQEIW